MTEIAVKVQHAARKWWGANEREINRIKYLSGELGSNFVQRVLRAKSRTERGKSHSVALREASVSASSSSSRMGSSNSSSSYS